MQDVFEWLTGARSVFGVQDASRVIAELNSPSLRGDDPAATSIGVGIDGEGNINRLGWLACNTMAGDLVPVEPTLILFQEDLSENFCRYCKVPLSLLRRAREEMVGTYTVYLHRFGRDWANNKRDLIAQWPTYIGITRNGWPSRWRQHISSANGGSPYRFHSAIRIAAARGWYIQHEVLDAGLSEEQALRREEDLVADLSYYPKGLNMIPGGLAGIRYLAQHGVHGVSSRKWEHRDALIRRLMRDCDRAGKPNPLTAALWRDDEYATAVICGNPRNFNASEVSSIRAAAQSGLTAKDIADRRGYKADRVSLLLKGETYARVQ